MLLYVQIETQLIYHLKRRTNEENNPLASYPVAKFFTSSLDILLYSLIQSELVACSRLNQLSHHPCLS